MIGYGEKKGIYCILHKNTIKAFRSRDVQFNEHIKKSAEETEFKISRNENQNSLKIENERNLQEDLKN